MSKVGRAQRLLAMIVGMHPGRHPLRVIFQSEQHCFKVQHVYMDGCLSHESVCNHCKIVHVDFMWTIVSIVHVDTGKIPLSLTLRIPSPW